MEPLIPDTSYHIFNHANGFENVFRHEANFYFFLEKYWKYIGPIAETYAWCLMPNHFHLVVRIRKRAILENEYIFSKVSNSDKGLIVNRNESSQTKEVNFGKDLVIVNRNVFSRTKEVNFGKDLVIVNRNESSRTKEVNFGKDLVIVNRNEFSRTKKANLGKDFDFDFAGDIQVSEIEIEKYLSKQFANLLSSYTQSFNKVYGRMGSLFIKNFKREPITDKTHFLNTVVYTHRNPIHHGFCKNYEDWPYSSYNEIIQGIKSGIETTKLLKMTSGLNGFLRIHQRSLDTLDNQNFPDLPLPI